MDFFLKGITSLIQNLKYVNTTIDTLKDIDPQVLQSLAKPLQRYKL